MAGMTENGLTILRQNEVIDELKAQAQPIFQDLVPPDDVVDTSNDSTIGRMIGLYSLPLADLWEAVQQVYLAFDPNSARGIALDNIVQYIGLTRKEATATTATVVVWGDENTDILGFINTVRATDNTLYDLTQTVSLKANKNIGVKLKIPSVVNGTTYSITITSGSVTINVSQVAGPSDTQATILSSLQSQLSSHTFLNVTLPASDIIQIESADVFTYIGISVTNLLINKVKGRTEVRNQLLGVKGQAAHTINQIATPLLGWDSVDNPFPAVSGEEKETDVELRNRFREAKFVGAQNISDSLYSSLLSLDGVEYANVYENETGVYDATYDLPGHSFKALVVGGVPADIAQVIWKNKPLGIGTEGNTSEFIFDSQGFQHEIKFSRPTPLRIYISMELSTYSGFPADGPNQIKSALAEYFRENFEIGQDVIYSRLFTPINTVPGHQINNLYIGTTASPVGVTNIVVNYDQIASLNTDDIIITVV